MTTNLVRAFGSHAITGRVGHGLGSTGREASLLDLIRCTIGGRGERMVWKRLRERHPEVEELTDAVSF